MKTFALPRGHTCIVDDEDLERLMQYRWVLRNNHIVVDNLKDYKRTVIRIPEIIFNDGKDYDDVQFIYRNGNSFDCRKENIYIGTVSLKLLHRDKIGRRLGKVCSSKYKGVTWREKRGKWLARIKLNRKEIFLGYFINEEEAGLAYNKKSLELFGDIGYQNKI